MGSWPTYDPGYTVNWGKVPDYKPHQPPRRLDHLGFEDEKELVWGRPWGANSKIGKLHCALVSSPGPEEIGEVTATDPEYFLYCGRAGVPGLGVAQSPEDLPDLELMRTQHAAYVQTLRDEGVEVVLANLPPRLHTAYGLPYRGAGYPPAFMVRDGCVIGRSALAWKRGQESIWARKMSELGVPILFTITGSGILEGRVDWIDSHHACLNVGHRGNREGFRQMEWLLHEQGTECVIPVELPGNILTHLDVVFTMVAPKLALVYPPGLPFEFMRLLESLGVGLVEIPGDEIGHGPGNAFPLEPGRVIMPLGAPETKRQMRASGVEIVEVDVSESLKLGAGPDCMTLSLIREPGPSLDD